MTREQCIGLLKRYAEYDGMGIPNLAGCKEAMRMAAELLDRPSLTSNEAAEKYRDFREECGIKDRVMLNEIEEAHYAGAEWMAGQFQKIEGELVDWYETKDVDYCCGIKTEDAFEVPEGFYIRKK